MFAQKFHKTAAPINLFRGRIRSGISPSLMRQAGKGSSGGGSSPAAAAAAALGQKPMSAHAQQAVGGKITDPTTWRRALRMGLQRPQTA